MNIKMEKEMEKEKNFIRIKNKIWRKYLDGKRWKGKGYDPDGNLEYGMENGFGYVKEYFSDGKVKSEGK